MGFGEPRRAMTSKRSDRGISRLLDISSVSLSSHASTRWCTRSISSRFENPFQQSVSSIHVLSRDIRKRKSLDDGTGV